MIGLKVGDVDEQLKAVQRDLFGFSLLHLHFQTKHFLYLLFPQLLISGCALFRRRGTVGSTAPGLGGGVSVSRSCLGGPPSSLGGVSIMLRWYLGHVSVASRVSVGGVFVIMTGHVEVVSRSGFCFVSVMIRWCLGHVLVVCWLCFGGALVMFRWCLGHVLAVSWSCLGSVWVMFMRYAHHV